MANSSEQRVWGLAEAQYGYVSRQQALALDLSRDAIRSRLASGEWRHIRPGIYILAGHSRSRLGLLAVACAALGGTVSHESAAELHAIPLVDRGLTVVTVGVRRTHVFESVRVHQSTDLADHETTTLRGLPVTTIERTIFDLAAVLRRQRLARVVDRCIASRRCTVAGLATTLDKLGRRGKPGTAAMREVLAGKRAGYKATESELEFRFAELVAAWRLPEPVRQPTLKWRSAREARVDFAYPAQRLIVELDGREWHSTAEAFDADRRRDNLALLAGWRVLRVTWAMINDRPHEVRAMIVDAIAMPHSA